MSFGKHPDSDVVANPTKVKVGERKRAKGEARLLDSTMGRVGGFGTSGEAATSGKSPAVLRELLASSMLNVEAGFAAVVTLPMVTSSVSATREHESGPPTDSIIRLNLRTLGPSERFFISSYSSHHSSTNATEAEIDSFVRFVTPPLVMTEAVITTNVASIPFASAPETGTKVVAPVYASMFFDSDSTETVKPPAAGLSHAPEKELSMGSRDINSETLHEIRKMDYHHLFTEFNVGTVRQACLNAKVKDAEIESLKAQLLLKETEATEVVHLRAQVSAAEVTKKIHAAKIDALK
uniref:Retrotransposon protein, putative, Ty1-copia subclass n=1 Tax=Tanacetum cinerariifolium TaxID=118510 RepID=A0A6L2K7A4_TANCI|nr:retrotransposon protein, putative, Ty1-copia subclass [Tanacetum cinerariifolium]